LACANQVELVGAAPIPRECAALRRNDFASFAARSFRELNPRAPFAMNWHVEVIAANPRRCSPAGSGG
jgi:hypothetical protein